MIHTRHTSNFADAVYQILRKYDGKTVNIVVAGGSLLKLLDNADLAGMSTAAWHVYYADERICDNVNDHNHYQSRVFLQHVEAEETPLTERNIRVYEGLFGEQTVDLALLGIGMDTLPLCSRTTRAWIARIMFVMSETRPSLRHVASR